MPLLDLAIYIIIVYYHSFQKHLESLTPKIANHHLPTKSQHLQLAFQF